MTMATESERIARIEGAYEHLATKADVETVKTAVHEVRAEVQTVKTELQNEIQTVRSEMHGEIAGIKNDLRWMKWALGIVVVGVLLPFLQSLLERMP
ncbi:MAG: hypothetical protein OXN19_06825 [Caldilineaceae bacterium]|nr:hypothetical protein [Caldilineaceae bacterium]